VRAPNPQLSLALSGYSNTARWDTDKLLAKGADALGQEVCVPCLSLCATISTVVHRDC